MTRIVSKIAAGLVAGSLLLAGTVADAKPRLTPEQQLAKTLEGRVAGEPVDCIYTPRVMSTRIYDNTAIVYDGGRTIWVNRPASGASALDDSNILVTQPTNSQLCSVDIVRLIDRTGGFFRGSIGLGQFVPYTKVKVAKAD